MASVVVSSLVCLLCVILPPAVWADYCRGYWDTNGHFYDPQQCGTRYCCGNCNSKYCCSEKENRLPEEKQELCSMRSSYGKKSKIAILLGSIIGSIIPIILCVSLIICCVAPCCLCYKKCCRKGRNRSRTHTSHVVMTTLTPANTPQQPVLPSGYQPSYPGYQSVPVQSGYEGPPVPTAPPPPSYLESEADPAYSPGLFSPGQPTYPFQLQPYTLPPHSAELAQPPYNPSYGP
ncbi:protein shisa-5-like [Thunnus thynnus]|uniref:protein shisa-5-like n=1 Tax=Thunnus thynnus TaxID=8237 RepID=UPI003527E5B8